MNRGCWQLWCHFFQRKCCLWPILDAALIFHIRSWHCKIWVKCENVMDFLHFVFLFFLSFFSFLKLFTIQKIKLKFTNKRKIKIKKKIKICHPIFPSLRLMKNNSLLLPLAPSYTPCLLPCLKTNLPPQLPPPSPLT